MEIGIDSFAASELSVDKKKVVNGSQVLNHLIDRIVAADEAGLDVFGIGEHHRKEFLDSSPALILAAAAAKTKKIKLTSAVTVLSADDPVRVFQDYATLDLISNGRAEMVVGRGSFVDAYPLFGYELKDYDALFAEKLDLLLKIQRSDTVTWQGRFRAPLHNQPIFPRPVQEPLPIWLGVGGTPQSFVRAGSLGMPLMVAIIGGETHRFRPLVDLYREAGAKAGYSQEQLTVGIHSFGYVAETTRTAADEAYPGMAAAFEKIRQERGWPPLTRSQFDAQMGPLGSYLIGGPDEVAEKIVRHSKALGGVSRVTFQMDVLNMGQEKLLQSIGLIGSRVATQLRNA